MTSATTMTSSRPYLVRALYEWIVDNSLTPYLLVDATYPGAQVPEQFIEDGKIVLNVGPAAVRDLDVGNEAIRFVARFAGTPMDVMIPAAAVLAIYARENGQGMAFQGQGDDQPPPQSPGPTKPNRPNLKVVK